MNSRAADRVGLAALGLGPVVPLLAWVYGLGSFAVWFWAVGGPALVVLALLGWVASRPRPRRAERASPGPSSPDRLHTILVAGTIGGLLGTVGYDLFRVPFAAAGLRVLAPIDSYGVLLLDARTSSPLSGFAGWGYHFSNGIGFGIAYAAVALGRRWWWGIGWGLVLETATLVTPFADAYGLRGQYGMIAVAYAAHVPYGLAVGWAGERGGTLVGQLREVSRRSTVYALAVLVAVLGVWHRPFSAGAGGAGASGAATTVVSGRFTPEWVRVPVGGCVTIRFEDRAAARRCFSEEGVHRVRLDDRPYSGGFVIADPGMDR